MPQLRWTLLILGVLFLGLLVLIERRRQHRGFLDQGPVEPDGAANRPTGSADNPAQPMFREPTLNLPEMRARDPITPHELPVVEIEEESLTARRVEPQQPAVNSRGGQPPTLSLPVMESGPAKRERPAVGRPVDPAAMSGSQWLRPATDAPVVPAVPRLDTPAAKRTPKTDTVPRIERIDLNAVGGLGEIPSEPHDEGDAERAFNEAVFGDIAPVLGNETDVALAAEVAAAADFKVEPVAAAASEEEGGPAAAEPTDYEGGATIAQEGEEAAPPPAPLFTAADVTPIKEPIVDWPPDDRRIVVALRLVAPPPERLAGRALRLALASEGFVLGKFQIFHKPDSSGRAVLSAANLSKPGTFDVETMDSQRFGGLSLFAVLPGPKPPLKAFEDLLTTARNLNERLQGALQDERGGPLTPTRIAALRESVSTEESP